MNAATVLDRDGLIHDWNTFEPAGRPRISPIQVHDESLRDGVQSPSVVDPTIEDKLQIVLRMDELGVDSVNVGLPGAGPRAFEDVIRLCRFKQEHRLSIGMTTAARTVVADIAPVAEVQQRTGVPLTVYTFIGSSPIRQFAEDWSVEELLRRSTEAIDFAVGEGLEVCYVTEDTTRSAPATLERLFRNAIDHGARRLCLCDTVGHATPEGVRSLIGWTRKLVASTGQQVAIDWHGHNDRGLALANALAAVEYGADRVHGTVLGIGERVGNTPLDLLLVNLKLRGLIDRDLRGLVALVDHVSRAVQVAIPASYPLAGQDAFRTGTGVHAAAIVKARRKNDAWLADRVYSSLAAAEFGKHQTIEIGPMSGMSNVSYWLEHRGIEQDEGLCRFILGMAKQTDRLLAEEAVHAAVRFYRTGGAA
jgi:2-isopropylmalate synthase